jgi:hypothetical protein
MSPLTNGPWDELTIDFYGPLSNGKYVFVIIDDHSRYSIAKIISSTSFKALQKALKEIFAMFGIPTTIRSDNGPPSNTSKLPTNKEMRRKSVDHTANDAKEKAATRTIMLKRGTSK